MKKTKITFSEFSSACSEADDARKTFIRRARRSALQRFWRFVEEHIIEGLHMGWYTDEEKTEAGKSIVFSIEKEMSPAWEPILNLFDGAAERRQSGGFSARTNTVLEKAMVRVLCDEYGLSYCCYRPDIRNPIQNVYLGVTRPSMGEDGFPGWAPSSVAAAVNRLAEMRGHALRLDPEHGGMVLSDPDDEGYYCYVWPEDDYVYWYVSCTGRTVAKFTNRMCCDGLTVWHSTGVKYIMSLDEAAVWDWEI
jgi:hypothetical protein